MENLEEHPQDTIRRFAKELEALHHTTRCEITLRRAQTSVITEYNSLTLWQKIKFAFNKKGLRNYEQSNNS